MASLKGSKTENNLKDAFAGESQANRRYLYFAQKADIEGHNDVSAVFRSTAEGETGHAHGHLEYLEAVGDPATGKPIGPTDKNLLSAIAGETHEYTDMYPGMARTAREEGFDEIADWFETLAKAEKSHAGRFQKALDTLEIGEWRLVNSGVDASRFAVARVVGSIVFHSLLTIRYSRVQMSREGSLEAPTRHPIAWQDDAFYDEKKLDAEMRRVFDICHGCRRCFNLCDSFPRLFDLIDSNPTEDVEGVKTADFSKVTEACTLCDMCFMTKCPYVPPHPFQVDFPHLLLRHRMVEARAGKKDFTARQLAEMDRNGTMIRPIAPLANWASAKGNKLTRPLMEKTLGIDAHAELPQFVSRTFVSQDRAAPIAPNRNAPAFGQRKAALFATCFVNYNKPATGLAARAVLNHIGIEARVAYPGCCGMPFLEQGELDRVAKQAVKLSAELCALIDEGYDIVTLTASCGLMLKSEWALILPGDPNVKKLSDAIFDIDEYVIEISKRHGLPDGLKALPEGVSVHMACHARAQNIGAKAAELLRLIPDTPIDVIERCAGHGGTFGVLKPTHAVAMKVGRAAMRSVAGQARGHVVSDCPLAGKHLLQGAREMAEKDGTPLPTRQAEHPIEVFARAYGLL